MADKPHNRILRVAHGNVHNKLGPARILTRAACDSIGYNEAWRLIPELRLLNGYTLLEAEGVPDPRSAETPILLRRRRRRLGHLTMKLADASTPERVAPERWINVALYQHPVGPVAHVNLHLHWIGPAHDRPGVARVEKTDEAGDRLLRLLRYLDWEGFARVVTGDVNIRRQAETPGWRSAWEVFEQAQLRARRVGPLDAIAWDPERLDLRQLDVIPADETATNHPMLIADLGAA